MAMVDYDTEGWRGRERKWHANIGHNGECQSTTEGQPPKREIGTREQVHETHPIKHKHSDADSQLDGLRRIRHMRSISTPGHCRTLYQASKPQRSCRGQHAIQTATTRTSWTPNRLSLAMATQSLPAMATTHPPLYSKMLCHGQKQ